MTDSDLSLIATSQFSSSTSALMDSTGITHSDLLLIATSQFSSLLFTLILQDKKGIIDAGMTAIRSGLHHFQSLDVTYCSKLMDEGLCAVAKGCSDLRSINVSGCKSVT